MFSQRLTVTAVTCKKLDCYPGDYIFQIKEGNWIVKILYQARIITISTGYYKSPNRSSTNRMKRP